MTNDAWYGRTGAPHQFLAITALRAAESGLWTIRAANTGVSALIDPTGRVRADTGLFERRVLVGEVTVRTAAWPVTFYARYGDVFVLGCAGILLVTLVRALARQRRRKRAPIEAQGSQREPKAEERESASEPRAAAEEQGNHERS